MKIKNLIIIIVVIFALISCNNNSGTCDATYFGGQIINPKSNFVTLEKNNVVIDTMYLDVKNNFSTILDADTEGLYTFICGSRTGTQYQYVYFEPKDSILMRLNTWDFDESLVFSGRGAEKNNFLITLYLQNEKNEKSFSSNYNLNSELFEKKITSYEAINNFLYEQLKESGVKISPKFDVLAKVAISYPLNRKREIYPLMHRNRFQLENYPTVSKTYYDFRKNIDLNNEDLIDFAPYYYYISSYLDVLAHQQKKKNMNVTVDKLNIIIENIKIQRLKNMLLHRVIYSDFRSSKSSCRMNQIALEIFNENCTNKKYLHQIKAMADDCVTIVQNRSIDNFEVITINNTKTKINTIIKDKKTIIYFWSPVIISPDMLIKRVKYLNNKFPNLLFLGINMDPSQISNRVNQKLKNQYLLTDNSEAHSFITSLEPRTILVDENGIVSNSFTYLSSPYLERQLKNLEKK